MNLNVFISILVAALLVSTCIGCHSSEDSKRKRRKRQAGDPRMMEVERSISLRDFFSDCLRRRAGDIWTWESVIDVTILDTQWFQNSDQSSCSEAENRDDVECWKSRLNQLLKFESMLQGPSRSCIDEYPANVTASRRSSNSFSRKKRQTDVECTTYFPNSPQVRMYGICNNNNVNLSPGRREIDFPSVTQFIAEEVTCGAEFSDCGENREETISNNDQSVPRWPYRFEAISRSDSPVRESVVSCNDMVFPLASDNDDDCQQWQNWSACSVTCRTGSQIRNRACPAGFTGERSETRDCDRGACGRSLLEIIRQLILFRLYGQNSGIGGEG